MKHVKKMIVLQYLSEGEQMTNSTKVHAMDANKFVAVDTTSGGYPYSVEIDDAHDFETIKRAKEYASHWKFNIREVTVTYEY